MGEDVIEELFRLEIPDVEPYPWPRSRINRSGKLYLPRNYVAARDLVAMHLNAASGRTPSSDPIRLVLGFYRSTKRRADLDNLAKTVLDAGNGIAWEDDDQVVSLVADKRYRPKAPAIEVIAYRYPDGVGLEPPNP